MHRLPPLTKRSKPAAIFEAKPTTFIRYITYVPKGVDYTKKHAPGYQAALDLRKNDLNDEEHSPGIYKDEITKKHIYMGNPTHGKDPTLGESNQNKSLAAKYFWHNLDSKTNQNFLEFRDNYRSVVEKEVVNCFYKNIDYTPYETMIFFVQGRARLKKTVVDKYKKEKKDQEISKRLQEMKKKKKEDYRLNKKQLKEQQQNEYFKRQLIRFHRNMLKEKSCLINNSKIIARLTRYSEIRRKNNSQNTEPTEFQRFMRTQLISKYSVKFGNRYDISVWETSDIFFYKVTKKNERLLQKQQKAFINRENALKKNKNNMVEGNSKKLSNFDQLKQHRIDKVREKRKLLGEEKKEQLQLEPEKPETQEDPQDDKALSEEAYAQYLKETKFTDPTKDLKTLNALNHKYSLNARKLRILEKEKARKLKAEQKQKLDEKKQNPDEKKQNPDEKKQNPDEKKQNPDEKKLPPNDDDQTL